MTMTDILVDLIANISIIESDNKKFKYSRSIRIIKRAYKKLVKRISKSTYETEDVFEFCKFIESASKLNYYDDNNDNGLKITYTNNFGYPKAALLKMDIDTDNSEIESKIKKAIYYFTPVILNEEMDGVIKIVYDVTYETNIGSTNKYSYTNNSTYHHETSSLSYINKFLYDCNNIEEYMINSSGYVLHKIFLIGIAEVCDKIENRMVEKYHKKRNLK